MSNLRDSECIGRRVQRRQLPGTRPGVGGHRRPSKEEARRRYYAYVINMTLTVIEQNHWWKMSVGGFVHSLKWHLIKHLTQ